MQNLGPYIIGLTGLTLSSDDIRRIQSPAVGGLILFSRNFESKDQLIDLVKSIRAEGGHEKPVFVDHEGGRVQRFRDGFTHIPAMRKLGELARENLDEALGLARQTGYVLAAELRACDIDMSFTPVLDLDWGNSEIIGDRSLGKDPVLVARLSSALMHGLLLAGMQGCGKHFPGHGWVKLDSHLALPTDTRPLQEIMDSDVLPYVQNGSLNMASVMPAHVVYSEVDPKPACFSPFWLQTVLRGQLAYDGAIISDDLEMAGAHGEGDIRERAASALRAGCDAVLCCNRFDDIEALVSQPVEQIAIDAEQRHRRLSRLRASGPSITWQQLQGSADYQQAVKAISAL